MGYQDVVFDYHYQYDATIMVSKNCPITGEQAGIMFVTQ